MKIVGAFGIFLLQATTQFGFYAARAPVDPEALVPHIPFFVAFFLPLIVGGISQFAVLCDSASLCNPRAISKQVALSLVLALLAWYVGFFVAVNTYGT